MVRACQLLQSCQLPVLTMCAQQARRACRAAAEELTGSQSSHMLMLRGSLAGPPSCGDLACHLLRCPAAGGLLGGQRCALGGLNHPKSALEPCQSGPDITLPPPLRYLRRRRHRRQGRHCHRAHHGRCRRPAAAIADLSGRPRAADARCALPADIPCGARLQAPVCGLARCAALGMPCARHLVPAHASHGPY